MNTLSKTMLIPVLAVSLSLLSGCKGGSSDPSPTTPVVPVGPPVVVVPVTPVVPVCTSDLSEDTNSECFHTFDGYKPSHIVGVTPPQGASLFNLLKLNSDGVRVQYANYFGIFRENLFLAYSRGGLLEDPDKMISADPVTGIANLYENTLGIPNWIFTKSLHGNMSYVAHTTNDVFDFGTDKQLSMTWVGDHGQTENYGEIFYKDLSHDYVNTHGEDLEYSFTLAKNSDVTGTTANGCVITGFYRIFHSQKNVLNFTLTLSECGAFNGTYVGLGHIFDDGIEILVSNNDTALHFDIN